MRIEGIKSIRSLVPDEIKHPHIYYGYRNLAWYGLTGRISYLNGYPHPILRRIFLLVGNNLYIKSFLRGVNRKVKIAYFERRLLYIFFF